MGVLETQADEGLVHAALAAEHELVNQRFKHGLNQLENTASLAVARKTIARLRTEVRAREIAGGLGRDELFRRHRGSFKATAADGVAAEKGGFLSGVVDKLSDTE